MGEQIDEYVRLCDACIRFSKTNAPAPLKITTANAKHPWDTISVDITGPSDRLNNQAFLTVIDFYSRFPFFMKLRNTTSTKIVNQLSSLFAIFGFPKHSGKIVNNDNHFLHMPTGPSTQAPVEHRYNLRPRQPVNYRV
jgi:hypothetical protein